VGVGRRRTANCFVIQPFGIKQHPRSGEAIDNDLVYEAVVKIENIRPTFPVIVSRADIGNVAKQDLHEHVVARLQDSDVCIADLTCQNPNVLYEAGVAKGFGLSVILICQDRADIPTDLTKYVNIEYSMRRLADLPNSIALHFDLIKREIIERAQRRWANVTYYSTRYDANIAGRILSAEHRIDILQTNLVTIATDYLPEIEQRMAERPELQLRLLTLNPQSIFVNYRGAQVGFSENIALYREELDSNLKTVHFSMRKFGDRVQIRTYDDFPTQIAFFFDEQILVCVVSSTGRSRQNCAFLLDAALPGASQSFTNHFRYLWEERSKPYPLPV